MFCGVECLRSRPPDPRGGLCGQAWVSPEFRRKVLSLVEAGKLVVDVAHHLVISKQSIYTWRRQDRIDTALSASFQRIGQRARPRAGAGGR